MSIDALYPLASLVIGGVCLLRARSRNAMRTWPIVYLLLGAFAILGYVYLLGLFLASASIALFSLLGVAGILAVLCATMSIDHDTPWRFPVWAAYVPVIAILGTVVLVLRNWQILSILRMSSARSTWVIGLAIGASVLLLAVGWKVVLAYLVAPLGALLSRRTGWGSGSHISLLYAAYNVSGLKVLDVRPQALAYYTRKGNHRRAGDLALELGDLDAARQHYGVLQDWNGQANVCAKQGQWERAAELHLKGNEPVKAARCYERDGKLVEAASHYREARDEAAFLAVCERGELFDMLGDYYKARREFADAINAYRKAGNLTEVARCQSAARDYQAAGETYVELGKYTEAEQEFEKAKDLPSYVRLLKDQGSTDVLEKMRQEAILKCAVLQRKDKEPSTRELREVHHWLLARLDLFDCANPTDAILLRRIGWAAIVFFEKQSNRDDLGRALGTARVLHGLVDQGLQLNQMETLALLVRLLLFSAVRREFPAAKQAAKQLAAALKSSDLSGLAQNEKDFVTRMMKNSIDVLAAHGQPQTALQVRRALKFIS